MHCHCLPFSCSFRLIGRWPLQAIIFLAVFCAGCASLTDSRLASVPQSASAPSQKNIPYSAAQYGAELMAKLPSFAGTADGQLWVLDSRGERLMQWRATGVDQVDLWLPDGEDRVFASDLVVQDGHIYLMATQRDAVYFVPQSELHALWQAGSIGLPQIRVRFLSPDDPRWQSVQQHFLRTGLWLNGQSRSALLARAQGLAADGWPVRLPSGLDGHLRYAVGPAAQGRLCVALAVGGLDGTSAVCAHLPAGWQVGAVYPLGLRAREGPVSCSGQALAAEGNWLWMEVDLLGESAYAIETRTVLMRVAVDQQRLRCWDKRGHMTDSKSSAALQRVYALNGALPQTLVQHASNLWHVQTPDLVPDFWPAPLEIGSSAPVFSFHSESAAAPDTVFDRAMQYTTQRWTLPNDQASLERYRQWSADGYFARCFPENAECGKPLAPRYLAVGRTGKTYTAVPYGWGANDSPDLFTQRIARGDYPGDIHTNQTILQSVAGADCSGLLGVVWQLPQRVTTTCRGGPDPWTPAPGDQSCIGAYAQRVDWQAAQLGDALLFPGHVRIVVRGVEPALQQAGRGMFVEIVESSGFCAGACHRLLPVRALGRYRVVRMR